MEQQKVKNIAKILSMVCSAAIIASTTQAKAADWSYPVINVIGGKDVRANWAALPTTKISKSWHFCVLLPNMSDSYWMSVDYGIVTEAKRDNIDLQIYQAGGYANLSTQINQFDNCIAQKYDAILVAAISADGVSTEVRKANAQGIAVVDIGNGINDSSVTAHSLMPFFKMGQTAGEFLIKDAAGKPASVALLPGPQGAGFSDDTVSGFKAAVANHPNIKILALQRGNLTVNTQLDLVNGALLANPTINYIVALNAGADAATVALRNMNGVGNVKVISICVDPQVYDAIKNNTVIAAVSDSPVVWAKIGVDMALRVLEHQDLPATRSGPVPQVLAPGAASNTSLAGLTLAPKDFDATFSVSPK